jgi:3-methyladenine DNA glycosylase AlkD
MDIDEIIQLLKEKANPKNAEGMKRFGIRGKILLGISAMDLRKLAKKIGKNHELAVKLWETEIHEARMMAPLIEEPESLSEKQLEEWVGEIDSWDICDMLTGSLLDKSGKAIASIPRWTKDDREFVRRTPFSMMAWLAVHDKNLKDENFEKYFRLIKEAATDERNFVKKAVNWALRQIGKRNMKLRKRALEVAEEIKKMDSKSARWIANGAINELSSPKTIEIIKRKSKKKE